MFLSTRGVPRNDISAGQNFCHKKLVKCELLLTVSGKLVTNVSKHSRKNIAVTLALVFLKFVWEC